MMDAVRDVRNDLSGEPASPTHSPNTLLLQAYLPGKPRIHPRRTLDQFFYHGLDTSARDRDQVVYRYCESHGMYVPTNRAPPFCLQILAKVLYHALNHLRSSTENFHG